MTTNAKRPGNTANPGPGTRERILAAARNLFHLHGYHAVGVQAICSDADVVKGSFYHFFPGKQALLEEVIRTSWAMIDDELERRSRQATDGRSQVLTHFSMLQDSADLELRDEKQLLGSLLGNLSAEISAANPPARFEIVAAFREWNRRLMRQVKAGVEDGSIAKTVDPAATAPGLLALLLGLSTMAQTSNDPAIIKFTTQAALKRLLPVPGR